MISWLRLLNSISAPSEPVTPTRVAPVKMASGEGGVLPDTLQEPGAAEARDGAENSPFRPHPSPQLSRRTLDELGEKNEDADDPENYPLNSPWAFWFDRYVAGGRGY